jgi:hypothetical protein
MTVPDGGSPPAGDDVLEMGSRRGPVLWWRPPTAALVLTVVALLVGLAVGYAAGVGHAGKPPSPPRPAASPTAPSFAVGGFPLTRPSFAVGGFPLSQTGPGCSAQIDHELQLGLEVMNLWDTPITLHRVEVMLPMGGLKATSQAWGSCGELPAPGEAPGNALPLTLAPGASAWFTVTFQVLVRCPQPLPVHFVLDYDQSGRSAAMPLPSFPDLGQVSYGKCA